MCYVAGDFGEFFHYVVDKNRPSIIVRYLVFVIRKIRHQTR